MPRLAAAPMNVRNSITSGYTDRRSYGRHGGVDIAPVGIPSSQFVPAVSVRGGRVLRTEYRPDYGNFVDVQLDNGLIARYAHLAGFNVHAGDTVRAGQTLGNVGSTGNSSGRHLHFELRTGLAQGQSVDPLPFLQELAGQVFRQDATLTNSRVDPKTRLPRQTPPQQAIPVRQSPQPRRKVPRIVVQETPSIEEINAGAPLFGEGNSLLTALLTGNQGTQLTPGGNLASAAAQGVVEGLGLPTGEEIETYIQDKIPVVVIGIISVIIILIGVARLVFSPTPLK